MRVEPLITSSGKQRYILLNSNGDPVEPVLRYMEDYKKQVSSRITYLKAKDKDMFEEILESLKSKREQ